MHLSARANNHEKHDAKRLGWIAGITIICVTINPALKAVGLLPADVFKSLGIFFPGLPQMCSDR